MISIIISTYRNDLFVNAITNIKHTIGDVIYEVVKIENKNKFGICYAYNLGIQKVKYNIVIFAHEDIIIYTKNWGSRLISTFAENPNIGLVGICGSKYKPYIYSGWAFASDQASVFMIHRPDKKKVLLLETINSVRTTHEINEVGISQYANRPCKNLYEEVVAIDGLFMATTREVLNEVSFDDKTFNDFHCYDIDISLQISLKYKVVVTHEILLEHLSTGKFNKTWFSETKKLHKKWQKVLPFFKGAYTNNEVVRSEIDALFFLVRTYHVRSFSFLKDLMVLVYMKAVRRFGIKFAYLFTYKAIYIYLFRK